MHSNTNASMLWAWMLSSSSALENKRYYGLCMNALKIECTRTRSLLWFGHGCSRHRVHWNTNFIMVRAWMLSSSSALEHERYYGLGTDAFVIECTGTRTLLWFGHGCFHHRVHSNTNVSMLWAWMLSSSSALEHECYYCLGMDALVTVCCWKRNKIADAFDNG